MKKNKTGFTLIELLVAIAIIGILAGVVLVSMSAYGARARASKTQAQLSGILPNMVSCWGNGNTVKNPVSGSAICRIPSGADLPGYGNWPATTGDLSTYSYGATSGTDYNVSSRNSWFFKLSSATDNVKICCNSTMNSCGNVGIATAACVQGTTW